MNGQCGPHGGQFTRIVEARTPSGGLGQVITCPRSPHPVRASALRPGIPGCGRDRSHAGQSPRRPEPRHLLGSWVIWPDVPGPGLVSEVHALPQSSPGSTICSRIHLGKRDHSGEQVRDSCVLPWSWWCGSRVELVRSAQRTPKAPVTHTTTTSRLPQPGAATPHSSSTTKQPAAAPTSVKPHQAARTPPDWSSTTHPRSSAPQPHSLYDRRSFVATATRYSQSQASVPSVAWLDAFASSITSARNAARPASSSRSAALYVGP